MNFPRPFPEPDESAFLHDLKNASGHYLPSPEELQQRKDAMRRLIHAHASEALVEQVLRTGHPCVEKVESIRHAMMGTASPRKIQAKLDELFLERKQDDAAANG